MAHASTLPDGGRMASDARDDDDAERGETIFDVLASGARGASDGALAACTAIGIAGIAAIALFAPGWWRLALPLASLAAFGAWGIAERSAGLTGGRARAAHVARVIAAVVGTAGAIATAAIVMAGIIGTWIS